MPVAIPTPAVTNGVITDPTQDANQHDRNVTPPSRKNSKTSKLNGGSQCFSSPPGSSMLDSPAMTTCSPINDAVFCSNSPSIDPGIIAVHGSIKTPILKDSGFFGLPRAQRDWDDNIKVLGKVENLDEPGKRALCGIYGPAREQTEEEKIKTKNLGVVPKEIVHLENNRVIALDFDDVCAQNNLALCLEHNAVYGTDLTLEDMESYVYFQNRGWGTPADVERKLAKLANLLPKTTPVPGFASALRALHSLGHPLHIITARPPSCRADVIDWLAQQGITVGAGPEHIIQEAWFVNTFGDSKKAVIGPKGDTESAIEREKDLNDRLKEIFSRGVGKGKGGLVKLEVLRKINASLFIDDHHGNLEPIVHADSPIPCLLFGSYAWNRSRSGVSSPVELMSFDERLAAGSELPKTDIEIGGNLHRVEGWGEVVEWVREWDANAAMGAGPA